MLRTKLDGKVSVKSQTFHRFSDPCAINRFTFGHCVVNCYVMPQTTDMVLHQVTISGHWLKDQLVLALPNTSEGQARIY